MNTDLLQRYRDHAFFIVGVISGLVFHFLFL